MLIPAVVGIVQWAPNVVLGGLFAIIVAAGAWEWARFARLESGLARGVYTVASIGVLVATWWYSDDPRVVAVCIALGLLWWCGAISYVVWLERGGKCRAVRVANPLSRSIAALCGWFVLVPAWLAIVVLHRLSEVGPHLVLALLVVVWGADIGAYFAGRRYGRHRLAPTVSPGKTWEGVAGGAVLAIGLGVVTAGVLGLPVVAVAAVSFGTVLFSVLGDLVESAFKRRAGVKDSGGVLPGHGGILDRIDSLTAAAPLYFAAFAVILGAKGTN